MEIVICQAGAPSWSSRYWTFHSGALSENTEEPPANIRHRRLIQKRTKYLKPTSTKQE